MKKFAVVLSALVLSTALLYGCTDEKKPVTDSENIPDNAETLAPGTEKELEEDVPGYKELYLETVSELNTRYEDVGWTYGLIDVNGDETPELVASYPATVSLYTCANGKIYAVMEEYSYGFTGNNGYSYLPGKNVIFNSNYDMAGVVVYENYCKIGEQYELENYHDKPLYTTVWKDVNGDGAPDDNEIGDTVYYFYGSDELTEETYNEYRFGDESAFELLYGEMSYVEIVEALSK